MFPHQIDLIARYAAHRMRMPLAERRAAAMPGDRLRHVPSAEPLHGGPQSEIDIFEIGFERLVERPDTAEQLGAEQRGGARRKPDTAAQGKTGPVGTSVTGAPGAARAAQCIERAVDHLPIRSLQDL